MVSIYGQGRVRVNSMCGEGGEDRVKVMSGRRQCGQGG